MKMRNVYLEGELANRFGEKITVAADTMADVFRLLNANDPTIKQYFVECHEKGINFSCETQKGAMDHEDCLLPLDENDIYLAPIPAGSKSAGAKILAAIAIAAMFAFGFYGGGSLQKFLFTVGKDGAITGLTVKGSMLAMVGLNLAMTGIQQMMMPDPSTDAGESSYLFNGNARTISEGDPIPILYGELRVPGRPIGFEIINQRTYTGGSGGHANNGNANGEVIQQLK